MWDCKDCAVRRAFVRMCVVAYVNLAYVNLMNVNLADVAQSLASIPKAK